ncbi:sensor domain-containing phosphodiesterase [Consotaella salsifontis]|uniref:Diguanylate cyclase (GGDEF) domain-containing protein n=1 Tax=Consotaella salsifontis TaxID=1365950 RepID=A0A1T4MN55_9HYPH|nr:sensor domain-containing phosphodiesterase [Consotaella salsifontis]SJZ68540.1 diguanylate cyclase (GGDEF) domain-containing protein [Consotaella salsifontis]
MILSNEEKERLETLDQYLLSGAFDERQFDHLVQLAARIFAIPNCYISTIGATAQICRAHTGEFHFEEIARQDSFCNWTIIDESDDILVVEDACEDSRFAQNMLVKGFPFVRFYAGAALISPSGHRIGALCLVDDKPHRLNEEERATLRCLASFVIEHIELMRLGHAARIDTLTQLANRTMLLSAIRKSFDDKVRATAMIIDLDGFKEINDTLGHNAGDFVLQAVGKRLRAFDGQDRVIARLGGDEFVLFIANSADPLASKRLAGDLIAAIQEPIDVDGQIVHICASVGIASTATLDSDEMQVLGNADLALYQAKATGRGCARIFTADLRHRALERGNINLELQEAWETRSFELYYQPQVSLRDGSWVGAEALIRWNYPHRGVVLPSAFLPVLEASHLAAPVGEWIIRAACRQAASWQELASGRFRMGVNLFGAQFRNRDLAAIVAKALDDHGLPSPALELEITENIILRREQSTMEQLEDLRAMGVGIAFDDFGTGYASLAMLKDYPVSRLKIDRSFIRTITSNRKDQVIVEAITSLAKGIGLEVIAEGIEHAEQAEIMRGYHCHEAQGYFFGRPMKAADFERQWQQSRERASLPILVGRAG